MIDISVVVPCYNVDKYVFSCLNSLVNQTKKEIEIIAINDGSTDNTLNILNDYEKKYPDKIRVISQENQGLSLARNTGIKLCNGKYIAFVDGDDEIDLNLFDKLWKKVLEFNYDIIAFNVELVYPNRKLIVNAGISSDIKDFSLDDKKHFFTNMYCMACNKLYKKNLFENEDLLFTPNTWFEDVLLIHKLIPNLTSIGYIDFPGYKYYQRENSITYTYNEKLYDILNIWDGIIKYYKENNIFNEYKNELEFSTIRYSFATFIKRLAKTKNKETFKLGVERAISNVNALFPNYKKNIYLKSFSPKIFYLKHFNKTFAYILFYLVNGLFFDFKERKGFNENR